MKQVDNIWLDIAGGDATGGYMETALREVGAGRIVYGTDVTGRSVTSQLAKVLAVDLPAADRDRILWRNATDILGERLPAAWRAAFARGGTSGEPRLPEVPQGGYVDANAFLGTGRAGACTARRRRRRPTSSRSGWPGWTPWASGGRPSPCWTPPG